MISLPPRVAKRTAALPKGLADHLLRTRRLARELAERHGVNPDSCELGAACHDLARHMRPKALLKEAERLDIPIGPIEQRVPIMLHGLVAARWLERDGEIFNSKVIESVRCHTTGKAKMSKVSKVVFLADKLEPYKVMRRPDLAEVLQLTYVDIDMALLEFLNRNIIRRVERGDLVHPATLKLRNKLKMKLPENEVLSGQKIPAEQGVR